LAAFVEALAEGRRVVVFGDASSRLSEHLLDRGARLVHVCDSDSARLAAAVTRSPSQHLSYAPLSSAGLAFREGAFDLGVIENLADHQSPPPDEVIRLLRRAVNVRGAVVVVTRSPQAAVTLGPQLATDPLRIDYYELYDMMTVSFESVRMFGQMPFVGYSVAEFGKRDDPEPVVDTALVPGGAEEPEWFVAVAGPSGLKLDSYSLIQLPASDLMPAGARAIQAKLREALEAERATSKRVGELVAEVSVLREKLRERSPEQGTQSVRHLQRALRQRDDWIEQLEARAATADARADMVQAELEALQESMSQKQPPPQAEPADAKLQELQDRSVALEAAAKAAEERCEALTAELDVERARSEELSRQVGASRQVDEEQGAEEQDDEDDLGRLEAQLLERGKAIGKLERQLRESQRAGQELVWRLEDLQAQGERPTEALQGWESQELPISPIESLAGANVGDPQWATNRPMLASESISRQQASVEQQLDRAASRSAELEADLVAATWLVAKLEAQVQDARAREAGQTDLQARLAEAQADLQRQAALVTQLEAASRSV
jgi:hypothetical protein